MIYFIGGGFGSPDYLTVKASKILRKADVVLFSRLIDRDILSVCKRNCKLVSLEGLKDDKITKLLKEYQNGATVYLTDGDFAFFGSIQNSFDFCIKNHIKYEIIPGINAVSASTSMLSQEMMIPNVSQCTIVTYAEDKGLMLENQKLSELAKHNATLFIYMAQIEQFSYISDSLLQGGYKKDTPVVIIKYLLSKNAEVIYTTVEKLPDITTEQYNGLAVMMIGDVFRKTYQSVSSNFRIAENSNWRNKMFSD